jgi:class 3 adenylate cyclase
MVDRGDHRIGDDERQQAIDMLRAHTGAGRLTLDEFSDLAGQVYAAQTYRELEAVAENLPPGLVPEPGATADAAAPGAASDGVGTVRGDTVAGAPGTPSDGRSARRRFVAIMSGSRARGRWRPAPTMSAFAFWGGVKIDLRNAEVDRPVVEITAWAIMGGVTVVVLPGTRVELDGMVLMGGSHHFSADGEPPPPAGSPVVRVHARGLWGGVTVRTGTTRERIDAAVRTVREQHLHHAHGHRRSRPPDPLELSQALMDDVAAALPRIVTPPAGVPRRRPGRGGRRHGWDDPWSEHQADERADDRATDRAGVEDTSRSSGTGDNGAAPPSGTLTMMVTDIAESTALAERLGDRRWMDVLGAHNALVRAQVAGHGGTEVKAQGDGFLVVFPSARRAILAAVEVQRALAGYRTANPDTPVAVRIGLHTGEIVDVDGDVFGQNVVVAARLAGEAEPGEIVVSALTRDLTVSGGDLSFGPAAEVELKGLSQPWRVHRVPWAVESA